MEDNIHEEAVCLLMACLMVSSFAYADDACPHYIRHLERVEYGVPIAYAQAHWIPVKKYYKCDDCNNEFLHPKTEYVVQGHSFYKRYEKHEGYNPILHVVEYYCTVCTYIYRVEQPCDDMCMIGFYSIDEPCVDH